MANPSQWVPTGSYNLPFNDNPNDPYDTLAATKRMLTAAGVGTNSPNHAMASKGFLLSDVANTGTPAAYKLPFGDIVKGQLVAHQKGLQTCAANLAKTTGLSPGVMDTCKSILAHYATMAP